MRLRDRNKKRLYPLVKSLAGSASAMALGLAILATQPVKPAHAFLTTLGLGGLSGLTGLSSIAAYNELSSMLNQEFASLSQELNGSSSSSTASAPTVTVQETFTPPDDVLKYSRAGDKLTNTENLNLAEPETWGIRGEEDAEIINKGKIAGTDLEQVTGMEVAMRGTIINEGDIEISGEQVVGIKATTDGKISNDGLIAVTGAEAEGIHAEGAEVTNNRSVQAAGAQTAGVRLKGKRLENDGRIDASGEEATGIDAQNATVINRQSVHAEGAGAKALRLSGGRLENAGRITASGERASAILAEARATIVNDHDGRMEAMGDAVVIEAPGDGVEIINRGSMQAETRALHVHGAGSKITNTGMIRSDSDEESAILMESNAGKIHNEGEIRGAHSAIMGNANGMRITNTGNVTANVRALHVVGADNNVVNHGNISGDETAIALEGEKNKVVNRGVITGGKQGIAAPAGENNHVVNHGVIAGGEEGIAFEGENNTVEVYGTVKGSKASVRFSGKGNHLVLDTSARLRGSVGLGEETTVRFTKTLNAVVEVDDGGKARFDDKTLAAGKSGGRHIASVDPVPLQYQTANAQEYTGGIMNALRSGMARLTGGTQVTAASGEGDLLQGSLSAERGWAAPGTPAVGSIGVLGEGFYRRQTADIPEGGRRISRVHGGLIGLHYVPVEGLLAGVFIGGGNGRQKVTQPIQLPGMVDETKTVSAFGGGFLRWEQDALFITAMLAGGTVRFDTSRAIFNMSTGNIEHARATFNGLFVGSEVGVGMNVDTGLAGIQVVPEAIAQVNYLHTPSYTETGSAGAVTKGANSHRSFGGRLQFTFIKDIMLESGTLRAHLTGGVALQHNNASAQAITLLGRSFNVASTARTRFASGIAGGGLAMNFNSGMSLYGNVEVKRSHTDAMTDVLARAGLKYQF